MPKVRPLTQEARNKAEDALKNDMIRSQIRAIAAYGHMNQEIMAAKAGIARPTLVRRMQNPESFTLRELRKIRRAAEALGLQFNY